MTDIIPEQESTGIICGGPEPHTMKACYGGCYEWCIHPLCSKAPEALTASERRQIRRFQIECGGYYRADLRELADFHLSAPLLDALKMLGVTEGMCSGCVVPKRQAEVLCRRGLAYRWDENGAYHVTGTGAFVLSKVTP